MTCLLEQESVEGDVEEFKMTHGEARVDTAESSYMCEALWGKLLLSVAA